jgi:hypothetical protein
VKFRFAKNAFSSPLAATQSSFVSQKTLSLRLFAISSAPLLTLEIPQCNAQIFDVASVKPNKSDSASMSVRFSIQALLADRLKLMLHKESKEDPIHALLVAKNGPKLSESPAEGPGMHSSRGELSGQALEISRLAEVLSNRKEIGRLVLNKTGLSGRYDFVIDHAEKPSENLTAT